ncbi:MAG: exodeoxyribonuclease V subunit gamma [Planctomycetes bacterium]|nr:exodeoxyribonuclease V subunit gamma [Planctomycetota bacterium]
MLDECLHRLAGPRQSVIYVVPTARRARTLEKELLHARPEGFFRPHLLTFHSLMQLLYRRMGGTGAPISESVKAMLIEEIVSDDALKLRYFRHREDRPFAGLVTRLAGFISDLKQNLIDPGTLERRTHDIEKPAGLKSRELVRIYREYQNMLDDHGLVDTDGMFWLVLEKLDQPRKLKDALGEIDLLLFDGFFDVTLAEGKVLGKLLEQTAQAWLRLDWLPGAGAYAAAEPFVLEYCAHAEQIPAAAAPGSPAEPLAPVLFDHERTSTKPCDVQILECRDRVAEVEAIAAEIKRLSVTGDFEANRIAVAFKNIETYAPIVRDVFASCGIPHNCAVGRPLGESPVTAALMSILEIVQEDYSREAVLKFLRSPYVHFGFEHDGAGAALDGNFVDVEARAARIFRGKATWAQKLRQAADLAEKGTAPERTDDADDDQPRRAADRAAKLTRQSHGIGLALEEISALARPMTPSDFRKTFDHIIKRFGIARGIFFRHRCQTDEEVLERDYRALEKFDKVLDDVTFAAGFSRRKNFEFDEYLEMIQAGLSGETFAVRRDVDHGVHVLPIHEVRGGDYDAVFVGGMVDGEFPRPQAPRIFYSDSRRTQLEFKTTPTSLEIERYLFASAAAAPRRRLMISYPTYDGGKTLLKSLFVREIERALPWVDTKRRPATGEVFSPKSLQSYLGGALAGRNASETRRAITICGNPANNAPDAMTRALAIEEMRRRGDAWSRFEGMLADPEVKRLIAQRYQERAFSASTLESYARCPFRFFAERVAQLEELEEPQEEIDALERGSVIHRMLSRFYIERRGRGTTQLSPDDDRNAALEHIRSIAEDEFEQLPYEGFFWDMERERIIGGHGRRSPGVLEMFIDAEISDDAPGKPRFFEVSFGHRRTDEISDTALQLPELVLGSGADEVRLAGRIDRVEVAELSGERLALAVDYKTGTPPHRDDIYDHIILQIPIYMMALEGSGYRPAGGTYYCLKDDPGQFGKAGSFFGLGVELKEHFGAPTQRRAGFLAEDELAEVLDRVRLKIVEYAAGIRGGVFPPSLLDPAQARCQYCAFSGVCRRHEAKAARMAPAADAATEGGDA